jgi:hypothetical protein
MTLVSKAFRGLLIFGCAALGAYPSTAWSQARVIKTSGNKAIVEFPADSPPEVGQRVYLTQSKTSRSGKGGPREHVLGLSADAFVLKDSRASGTNTSISVTGRFGWNLENFEWGPIGRVGYTNDGVSSSTRDLAVGVFADFNLIPNMPNEDSIYGFFAEGTYGMLTTTTMSVEQSTTTMELFGGGFLKWFLAPSVCARTDAGVDFVTKNETPGQSTLTGAKVRIGLQVYF